MASESDAHRAPNIECGALAIQAKPCAGRNLLAGIYASVVARTPFAGLRTDQLLSRMSDMYGHNDGRQRNFYLRNPPMRPDTRNGGEDCGRA